MTSPLVGACKPVAIVKKVLLPEPEGPITATNSLAEPQKIIL